MLPWYRLKWFVKSNFVFNVIYRVERIVSNFPVSEKVNGNRESILPKSKLKLERVVRKASKKYKPWENRLMIRPGGFTLKKRIGAFISPANEISCRFRPDLTIKLKSNKCATVPIMYVPAKTAPYQIKSLTRESMSFWLSRQLFRGLAAEV